MGLKSENIIKYLPSNLTLWLDENNLIWGDNLDHIFERVIKTEKYSDFRLYRSGNESSIGNWEKWF